MSNSLASNGELTKAWEQLRDRWINLQTTTAIAPSEKDRWNQLLSVLSLPQSNINSEFQEAWEQVLIIELMFKRENYTNGFMLFAQLLERILSIRSREENWKMNNNNFVHLIDAWENNHGDGNTKNILDNIRTKRNQVVHEGLPIDCDKLGEIWNIPEPDRASTDYIKLLTDILETVAGNNHKYPQELLLRSLYQWGLEVLKT